MLELEGPLEFGEQAKEVGSWRCLDGTNRIRTTWISLEELSVQGKRLVLGEIAKF